MESGLSLEFSKGDVTFLGTTQNEESGISDEEPWMNGNESPSSEETSYTSDYNSTKLSEDDSSSKEYGTLNPNPNPIPPPSPYRKSRDSKSTVFFDSLTDPNA